MNGVEVAQVTTAIAMDAVLEAKVLAKIASLSDKKITIENHVDCLIIGGFILRIGDAIQCVSSQQITSIKRELSN
jgi:F-type H+-transporting ATPase subunit delta